VTGRPTKLTEAKVTRLLKAARKADVNVRMEFRSDGTIIVTTAKGGDVSVSDNLNSDLDDWMKKNHANPA
jgi:hypothetical protein